MDIPVAIVGLGISGKSAIRLLISRGVRESDILTFDDKAAEAAYSSPAALIREGKPKSLVVSPGYPLASKWIQEFRARGGFVTSELALALEELTTEKVIGISGSLGKSTVVSLLGAGAARALTGAFVGGNLGVPLADYAAELREGKRKTRAPWVVLELSSFQLENCGTLAPEIAALTYFAPNHLERYSGLEEYYARKWELAERATAKIFLNAHGGDLKKFAAKQKATPAAVHWIDPTSSPFTAAELASAKLLGAHNRDNLALAGAIAAAAGWDKEYRQAMLDFPGLPHRMQNLGERSGGLFINDSKATNLASVFTAANGALGAHSGRVVLLLGGKDKNLPWKQLAVLGNKSRLSCVFFGDCAALAQRESGLPGPEFATLEMAMRALPGIAKRGDLVLLSPGGSSYDEFKNFEERGRMFDSWTKELF